MERALTKVGKVGAGASNLRLVGKLFPAEGRAQPALGTPLPGEGRAQLAVLFSILLLNPSSRFLIEIRYFTENRKGTVRTI